MRNKLFFYDSINNKKYTYDDLIIYLNKATFIPKNIFSSNYFEIFTNIILGIIYDKEITLLDSDFSKNEIELLSIKDINYTYVLKKENEITLNSIIDKIQNSTKAIINLFTSGTTGLPKKVSHKIENIIRMVKINRIRENDIWGFAYNPTHIAGIQVFFQALLNQNTIINLFNISRKNILNLIEEFKISNISATPTFYRLLLPVEQSFTSVKKITYGGERFDKSVANELTKMFPNAKMLNIYASTEAGSLLATNGDIFEIKNEFKNLIKIDNNELLIHKKLLGFSHSLEINQDWYHTGDIVEFIDKNNVQFKIIGKKNEMINIGGYKVNPLEVEAILNQHDKIISCRVYAKKNSLFGSILAADIVKKDKLSEKNIRDYLDDKLQSFKIPRLIKFVDNLNQTRTGKLKRET